MKNNRCRSLVLGLSLALSMLTVNARKQPFCAKLPKQKPLVIAYLGADTSWEITPSDKKALRKQLNQVNVVNYSFARLKKNGKGHTSLFLSKKDKENIKTIRQIKPDLPIIIAVGGWGEKEGFKAVLTKDNERNIFLQSVKRLIEDNHLDGIDLDWENELLASADEIQGVSNLLKGLHQTLSQQGYCVSNAVPGTQAYWRNYPSAAIWHSYVNWTTIMAYDNYGTFGPRTQHGAALYDSTIERNNKGYPYPPTSGNKAVLHYFKQGLNADKLVLGIPFYCHSYYIHQNNIDANSKYPGLYSQVLDPNINSQKDYKKMYKKVGDQLFAYPKGYINKSSVFSQYGLIPVKDTSIFEFISCDSPLTVQQKVNYANGNNPLSSITQQETSLRGIAFWSLQQDLDFKHPKSLLRSITKHIKNQA